MKNIFEAANIGGLHLKNRLLRSATWLAAADDEGNLTEKIFETYQQLAAGGVGAIVTGITTISPHDALIEGIAQFHSDKFIARHKKFTDMIHAHDCKIFLQAAIVDSVFYLGADLYRVPLDQLADENISEVVKLFAEAAVRAQAADYDGIQLHAAHGFFLSQYITHDEKILGDILDAIHSVTENFPVIAKINGEDCLPACSVMSRHGIDAIEISGNYTSREARAGFNEAYFKNYALAVTKKISAPIILVGGFRSVEEMNKILATTDIEFISLSRALIREPNIINRWKSGDLRPSKCIGCNMCYRTPAHKCIFVLKGRD